MSEPNRGQESDFTVGGRQVFPGINRIGENQVDQKTMAVLQLLVQAAPAAVSVQQILNSVWPDRVVVDNVVHKAINQLRRCFADSATSPRYVQTIRGRGYRLIAEVRPKVVLDTRRHPVLGVSELTVLTTDSRLPQVTQALREDLLTELNFARDISVVMSSDQQPRASIDYLLNGSLRSSKQEMVAAFQLIDNEYNVLWASSYQLDSGTTQFAKASLVARLIQSTINVAENRSSHVFQHQRAHECWRSYQLERNKILLGVDGSWQLAVRYLSQLTHLEPDFVGAHQQLAIAYSDRLGLAISVDEASTLAHHHIREAIQIAPEDWFNYFIRGKVNHELDLDYVGAEKHLGQALAMGAPVGSVSSQLGIAYLKEANLGRAIEYFQDAVASDPSSSAPANLIGWGLSLLSQGDYDAAVDIFEKAEATAGNTEIAVNIRVQKTYACHFAGMAKFANTALNEALQLAGDRKFLLPGALVLLERDDLAGELIASLEARHKRGEFVRRSPMFLAYFFAGDWDQAFRWLNRAIEDRDGWIFPVLRRAPYLAELRTDKRFYRAIARLDSLEVRHSAA